MSLNLNPDQWNELRHKQEADFPKIIADIIKERDALRREVAQLRYCLQMAAERERISSSQLLNRHPKDAQADDDEQHNPRTSTDACAVRPSGRGENADDGEDEYDPVEQG